MRFLLLLFVAMPILEMWLLFKVAGVVGAWPTIALVLLTAVVGVALLRRQGLQTLLRGRRRLEAGELPALEMLEGLVLAVSGALLLTPGFVTDTLGFLGLLPWSRRWLVRKLTARADVVSFTTYSVHNRHREVDSHTVEGEYWREEDHRDP